MYIPLNRLATVKYGWIIDMRAQRPVPLRFAHMVWTALTAQQHNASRFECWDEICANNNMSSTLGSSNEGREKQDKPPIRGLLHLFFSLLDPIADGLALWRNKMYPEINRWFNQLILCANANGQYYGVCVYVCEWVYACCGFAWLKNQ